MNQPTLHIIVSDTHMQPNAASFDLLLKAAQSRRLAVNVLESGRADFTNLPVLSEGDLLYRKSTDSTSHRMESLLLHDNLITLYRDKPVMTQKSRSDWSSAITLQKAGLPIIPTVFSFPMDSQDALLQYVSNLGGFPVIVKASGAAHGNGVFRFDSIESLWSARPLLEPFKNEEKLVLRKYISHSYHARLIVLGDSVVDSIEYRKPENDFRTNNLDSPDVSARKFSEEVEHLAVDAARVLNLDFAGVDIMHDSESNQYLIAEVNFPCNFSRAQQITNTDIAGLMIDFMLRKGNR